MQLACLLSSQFSFFFFCLHLYTTLLQFDSGRSTLIIPPLSTAFSLPGDDVGLPVDPSVNVMGDDEVLHPGGLDLEIQNKHEGQEGARWSTGATCQCMARRNNFSAFSWFVVTSSRSRRRLYLFKQLPISTQQTTLASPSLLASRV